MYDGELVPLQVTERERKRDNLVYLVVLLPKITYIVVREDRLLNTSDGRNFILLLHTYLEEKAFCCSKR